MMKACYLYKFILLPDGLMMGSVVASVGKTALPSVNVAVSAAAVTLDETEEFVESVEWCCAVF